MRRWTWMVAVMLAAALVLAGCGKKDTATIVSDLETRVKELDSYHAEGQMILHTGMDPQEYAVEVCYQAPNYYRIALTNQKKDITQIVLRNDDGVFVLTPHLNKSFRFQSNWPENQGQFYLYQSLVQSIVMDQERQFLDEADGYVFDVVANYQNGSLARQKIWLDKKTYEPKHVEVSDSNANVMVIVKFNEFEFGTKFDKDQFDMQRNMTGWNIQSLPTKALGEGEQAGHAGHNHGTAGTNNSTDGTAADAANAGSGAAASGSAATGGDSGTAQAQSFGVIEPHYMPAGVKKQDATEMMLGEDKAVMLRYSGAYNYTLLESWPQEQAVSLMWPGDPVDLGFTIAVLTGEKQKTMTWTYDGVEFRLASEDLPLEEMIKIAHAVQGEMGK